MDRFYPVGLAAEADAWKTTYEEANEMRSFARSAYPPGTSIHLPGQRDMFGFSAPGPARERLAKPYLHPTEEVDVPNPREHHAITRVQIDDEHDVFHRHDVNDMLSSKHGPMVAAIFNRGADGTYRPPSSPGGLSLSKSRSLPNIAPAPARRCQPPEIVDRHEDDHFSYFVPRSMQGDGVAKLNTHHMSKLHKASRISFPFSGEGTGFRSQSGITEVFPQGSYKDLTTTHRHFFKKPPHFRMSPLQQGGLMTC